MKISIPAMVSALALASPMAAQTVRVAVDPRAEILWAMFRTAGAREFSQGSLKPYVDQIDSAFGAFKSHAATREINERREKQGVSLNAVVSLAAHITDPIAFEERAPFDSSPSTLDGRWGGAEVRPLLRAARDFARDARVAAFLHAQARVYDSASVRMERLVRRGNMAWFNAFFGEPVGAAFVVVPLLANSGGNFGTQFVSGATRELYAFVSLIQADSLGFPMVGEEQLRTVVHELNHSFVDHLVTSHEEALRPAAVRVYAAVRPEMRLLGYASWKTMVDESLVRAAVIRYVHANESGANAGLETRSQQGLGFIWMDELVALLDEYEGNRSAYPSLSTFMPRIVAFYDSLAPRVEAMKAAFDARRPRIVASSIADRAKDIDPGLTEITVRFDQKMGPGISLSPFEGSFPELTGYGFDPSGTSFTLRVKLAPKRYYGIRFHGHSFASVDGRPLKEYMVRFTTR